MRWPSPCTGAGQADYKTDYIAAGCSWTTLGESWPRTTYSRAVLDIPGQRWTARRVLYDCRVQVRFLSHLPAENLNSWGLQALWLQPIVRALISI